MLFRIQTHTIPCMKGLISVKTYLVGISVAVLLHTLPKSHSQMIGAFTNDLLHKTTYISIKLALFWVMLGSWPFESKQILTWPFQRGIIQLCRSKGCQMTSPQSRSLELRSRERFGVAPALAAAGRPSWASANPAKEHFIAGLWGLVVWQPLGPQSHTIPLWKALNFL